MEYWSVGMLEMILIITPILNDLNKFAILNFGHWKLFVFWDLLFGIFFDAPLLY